MNIHEGLPIFEIEFDEDVFTQGVNFISLVKSPATESNFFKFSKHDDKKQLNKLEFKFAVEDEAERLITGVIMLADKPIKRIVQGKTPEEDEAFYIRFGPKVVKEMAFKYMEDQFGKNVNIEHDPTNRASEVAIVETWIFDEARGMNKPDYIEATPGSWLGTMRVKNDEVWADIMAGKIEGFSLEGDFGLSLNMSKEINIFTEDEKTTLLTHLSTKGHKRPDNWKLIHSELCTPDEEMFDVEGLLNGLKSNLKFAVNVVSNPDEESRLDKGVIKVRYRYVLDLAHLGEPLVKDNTREFCEVLVRDDKIYRREDINIMSFRGANPIANQNYSIFRLQGHWNCRHAWQREVYLIENEAAGVEDNPLVNTKLSKNKIMNLIDKIKMLFTDEKTTLTKAELEAKIAEIEAEELKLADVKSGEMTLRVDGEIVEGSAVLLVLEDGTTEEVPNGDYPLADDGKILTITDGVITEVKDAAEAADAAEGEEPAENFEAALAKLETKILASIDENLETKLSAHSNEVIEKVKALPAFTAQLPNGNFAQQQDEEGERKTINSNLNSDFVRREK